MISAAPAAPASHSPTSSTAGSGPSAAAVDDACMDARTPGPMARVGAFDCTMKICRAGTITAAPASTGSSHKP